MYKFCPSCGVELEREFKFCPECGFELKTGNKKTDENDLTNNRSKRSDEISENALICEICGEENDLNNYVCSGCGAKLKNPNAPSGKDVKKEELASANKLYKSKKQNYKPANKVYLPNKKTTAPNQNSKKLNNARVITVIAIGLGISLLILIFSGKLDFFISPTPKTPQNVAQDQSSNVDLGSIQKINDLEKVVKENPQDTSAILSLAHAKNDANLFDQAIVNYKQYLALVPKDPDARIDMGICYYNLKDYDTAINEMEQAIRVDPKHQIGYLDLGIVSLTKGDFAESKKWLQKAVALDPGSDYGKKAEELLQSHSTNQGGN
ncbi:MAG: tetratricopeptide repeat protein [Ignavibacteriaceae bacterium]